MDLLAFAAERRARLVAADEEIESLVRQALSRWGAANWTEPIVTGASVLFLEIFERENPDADPQRYVADFQRALAESLAKTKRPEALDRDIQVGRITRWIGTYSVNAATYFAARGTTARKIWVSMDDDDVRPTHRAADGQSVPIGAEFDVGGYRLRFPGEPVGPPEVWIECRCLVASEVRGGASMDGQAFEVDPALDREPDEIVDEMPEDEALVDDVFEIPISGVLAPLGVMSGDNRMFKEGSMDFRDLPLPVRFETMSGPNGHDNAVVVGRIDRAWVDGNLARFEGALNPNARFVDEVVDGIAFGMYRGISIDADDVEIEMPDMDDPEVQEQIAAGSLPTIFSRVRTAAFTIVPIPAFQEAFLKLGLYEDEERTEATEEEPEEAMVAAGDEMISESWAAVPEEFRALVAAIEAAHADRVPADLAAFAPGTKDGPGWITNPRATARIRRYWTQGKGAAKIRWGVPGDFNRCRRQLSKYVNPAFLAGTCANMHKEALGVWPGRERGNFALDATPALNLVASVSAPSVPPAEWFEDPQLTGPTPITITEDGRIFGHLAVWGTCHIGFTDVCTTPPSSKTGYSLFHLGAIETTGGEIAVGQLTLGTGHASLRAGARAAAAHYDNTGLAAADVRAGEDGTGIWVAGAVRPGLTDEEIRELKASKLSGDWRRVNGNLEMVGALCVNVPGFAVPRTSLAASGGHQTALIASGILEDTMAPTITLDVEQAVGLVAAVADELEHREEKRRRLAAAREIFDAELAEAQARREERIARAKSLIEA